MNKVKLPVIPEQEFDFLYSGNNFKSHSFSSLHFFCSMCTMCR